VDYSVLDDESLIRLVAVSRSEALSALYDRYNRLVFSMALHAVGDPATAEEITQDVFFRVWEKAGTYRMEQARVSTWLVSITRYRSIDILRQRGARPQLHDDAGEALAAMPDSNPGPEDQADQTLEQRRVRAALAALPPEQRRSVELAYYGGLSHSEIASATGEPLGTIKTRIRMAMQKLRQMLRDDLPVGR
jgi:RNA polymerase sigma-70 factor (ECF subfamily)